MTLRLRYAALSDVGRVRKNNQDSGYAGAHLLAIADGVGGAARGDIASSAAIEQLRGLDEQTLTGPEESRAALSEAIRAAHERIGGLVREHPELEGTSTTVTAAVFNGEVLTLGHSGDSRGYLLRGGELTQLTSDHTFVQSLIDEGRITEAEARVHPHRNFIIRSVDGEHEPDPDLFGLEVHAGDRFLLCSDGCSGVLEASDLTQLLGGSDDLDGVAHALVTAALEAGSSDNVTVVVAEAEQAGPQPEAAGATAVEEPIEAGPAAAAPLVVGAAAVAPIQALGRPSRGLLRGFRSGDTGELEPVAGEHDDEQRRYAPREPRRYTWLRRVAALVVALLVLAGIGAGAYAWSQTQYYVAPAQGNVGIYQGIEATVPGLSLHHLKTRTSLPISRLRPYDAQQVRDGITADGFTSARQIVTHLRGLASCPPMPKATSSPTATATSHPTRHPTRPPTRHPSRTGHPRATHRSTSRSSPTTRTSGSTSRPRRHPSSTATHSPTATSTSGSKSRCGSGTR